MDKLSEKLMEMESIQAPVWAQFVKTGVHKERPPVDNNWWVIRSASILRKIAKHGPIGVNSLAKMYGGRQNRGYKPDIKRMASRNIIRKCIQQLESSGLVHSNTQGNKSGKILTAEGKKLLQDMKEVSE